MTTTTCKSEEATYIYQFRTSSSNSLWWNVLLLLTAVTVATRFHQLDLPNNLCWDEVHFANYAAQYINRTAFFDTHPPLGKMILGFVGYLNGFNLTLHQIRVRNGYGDTPYVGLRMFCTTMGALLVPLSFLTVWEMTSSLPASTFSAALLIFENGMITLNRFILPDPLMLFFISASFYSMIKFNSQRHRPFSGWWWWWLSTVGVMMSGCIGIKFVGLFIFIVVGVRAAIDLWIILGDISKPVSHTLKHLLARVTCLIVLPAALYVAYFYVHLRVLHLSKGGLDHFMVYSSAFQVSFEDSELRNTSTSHEVAFGSAVAIRSNRVGGSLLSSTDEFYPIKFGMNQQIVSATFERALPSKWSIIPFDGPIPHWNSSDQVRFIHHGDLIRLEHKITQKNLRPQKTPGIRTHNDRLIVSRQTGEVDVNDIWQVFIDGAEKFSTVLTVNQPFRLIHSITGCALRKIIVDDDLSEWGDYKLKVSCNPNRRSKSAVWYLESSEHRLLPNVSYLQTYELNFMQRFIETHFSMFEINARLVAKVNESTSRPWMWPILHKGQFFLTHADTVYLLGNPLVFWGNCFFLIAYWIFVGVKMVRNKRQATSSPRQTVLQDRTSNACLWLHLGWVAHYLPFWPMTRALYFHHYFPALLFSIMISGIMLHYLIESVVPLSPQGTNFFYCLIIAPVLGGLCYSFYLFAPLVYGMPNIHSSFPDSAMYERKWVSSWEF